MESPSWAVGLHRSGLYYEGVVDDLSKTLDAHHKATVTTYGTRTSSFTKSKLSSRDHNKENSNVAENSGLPSAAESKVSRLHQTNICTFSSTQYT